MPAARVRIGWVMLLLAGGCCPQPLSPSLADLEALKVHVAKVQGTREVDVYKVSYMVCAPLRHAWDPCWEVQEWLQSTALVDRVEQVGSTAEEQRYRVHYRNPVTNAINRRRIVVRRDDDAKRIHIEPDTIAEGQIAGCTITMRPFFEESTLVEVEVRFTSGWLTRVLEFLLAPVGLIAGNPVDRWVQKFAQDVANKHRRVANAAYRAGAGPPNKHQLAQPG